MTSKQLALLLRYINARAEYVRNPSAAASLRLADIIGELEATVEDAP